jgi:hypothetical protein
MARRRRANRLAFGAFGEVQESEQRGQAQRPVQKHRHELVAPAEREVVEVGGVFVDHGSAE